MLRVLISTISIMIIYILRLIGQTCHTWKLIPIIKWVIPFHWNNFFHKFNVFILSSWASSILRSLALNILFFWNELILLSNICYTFTTDTFNNSIVAFHAWRVWVKGNILPITLFVLVNHASKIHLSFLLW